MLDIRGRGQLYHQDLKYVFKKISVSRDTFSRY